MCVVTASGIKMNDGNFLPFDSELADISPKYIEELSKNNSTIWEHYLLHRQIKQLENKVVPYLEIISRHTTGCPVNREAVEGIVMNQMKLVGKRGWKGMLETIKNVSLIATAILVILKILERI